MLLSRSQACLSWDMRGLPSLWLPAFPPSRDPYPHLQSPFFHIRSHSRVPGRRTWVPLGPATVHCDSHGRRRSDLSPASRTSIGCGVTGLTMLSSSWEAPASDSIPAQAGTPLPGLAAGGWAPVRGRWGCRWSGGQESAHGSQDTTLGLTQRSLPTGPWRAQV